jgi:hypothetical protein
MSRHKYQGTAQDATGRVIASASYTVYLSDGTTLATIYSAVSGGTAAVGSVVQSDSNGEFEFFVDDSEYTPSQLFQIVMSKLGYTTVTWEYVKIIPGIAYTEDTTAAGAGTDGTISSRSANAMGECDGFLKIPKSDGTLVYVPYWDDITP